MTIIKVILIITNLVILILNIYQDFKILKYLKALDKKVNHNDYEIDLNNCIAREIRDKVTDLLKSNNEKKV